MSNSNATFSSLSADEKARVYGKFVVAFANADAQIISPAFTNADSALYKDTAGDLWRPWGIALHLFAAHRAWLDSKPSFVTFDELREVERWGIAMSDALARVQHSVIGRTFSGFGGQIKHGALAYDGMLFIAIALTDALIEVISSLDLPMKLDDIKAVNARLKIEPTDGAGRADQSRAVFTAVRGALGVLKGVFDVGWDSQLELSSTVENSFRFYTLESWLESSISAAQAVVEDAAEGGSEPKTIPSVWPHLRTAVETIVTELDKINIAKADGVAFRPFAPIMEAIGFIRRAESAPTPGGRAIHAEDAASALVAFNMAMVKTDVVQDGKVIKLVRSNMLDEAIQTEASRAFALAFYADYLESNPHPTVVYGGGTGIDDHNLRARFAEEIGSNRGLAMLVISNVITGWLVTTCGDDEALRQSVIGRVQHSVAEANEVANAVTFDLESASEEMKTFLRFMAERSGISVEELAKSTTLASPILPIILNGKSEDEIRAFAASFVELKDPAEGGEEIANKDADAA